MHPIGVRRRACNEIPHFGALRIQGGPNRRNRLVPIQRKSRRTRLMRISCPLFADPIVPLPLCFRFGPRSPNKRPIPASVALRHVVA
jgi:hypothetical protein